MKVCHLTSVHQRYDIRIFEKECVSLARYGFSINLIVNDAFGDEIHKGVSIISTGYNEKNRLKRLLFGRRVLYKKALDCNADIYHLHDPELLSLGIRLYKKGKIVIYDSHEDVPRQILAKQWIPKYLRKIISKIVELYEEYCARKFSAIIVPTPHIEKRYRRLNKHVSQVCNFPMLDEFIVPSKHVKKECDICYIGGLSRIRGVEIDTKAAEELGIKLEIAGKFESDNFKEYIMSFFKNVNYHGILNRKEVVDLLASSKVGLATLLPTPNHINAYPIKLFEYMASGIPVVASDFPLWKSIIDESRCGYCVNPEDINAVTTAIKKLLDNPQEASIMGDNGRKAVMEQYNWNIQEKELVSLYQSFKRKREV